jgi:hypothetical protein
MVNHLLYDDEFFGYGVSGYFIKRKSVNTWRNITTGFERMAGISFLITKGMKKQEEEN